MSSIKFFASMTPIIGRTHEEAVAKYEEALSYASEEAGLACWCGNTDIDLWQSNASIQSFVSNLSYKGNDIPKWTPRNIGKTIAIGGFGPLTIGTAEEVADEMERWMEIGDIDEFNLGHVTVPGTWEDVVELLVPELRKRGRYAPEGETGTMRERVYGPGQSKLRDDHHIARYKYDVYQKQ